VRRRHVRLLTPRQLDILVGYLETGSIKAAADREGIRESTARQHLSLAYRRLGVRTAVQAVWIARREIAARSIDIEQLSDYRSR
jgi:DNA-binding NarL/FixJ family response regulator